MGVALEANGAIVEDACWLQPKNDARHINLGEPDHFKGSKYGASVVSQGASHCHRLSVYASMDT